MTRAEKIWRAAEEIAANAAGLGYSFRRGDYTLTKSAEAKLEAAIAELKHLLSRQRKACQ